ncbi:hypothetical protein [Coralliovum pocilloporae]|uniref:hypothetical protein n=1 Tax=Coralliovum pocilloporae TaxID=3066369 RepID=UPI003307C409
MEHSNTSRLSVLRHLLMILALTSLGVIDSLTSSAWAEPNSRFLSRLDGTWEGRGHMAFGPQNTFDFNCRIQGDPKRQGQQVKLTASCWRGLLSTSMNAELKYNPRTRRYEGLFNDVTKAWKIDINGRRKGNRLSLDLKQGRGRGILSAKFTKDDKLDLNVSIVHLKSKRKIPVISVNLKKTSDKTVTRRLR